MSGDADADSEEGPDIVETLVSGGAEFLDIVWLWVAFAILFGPFSSVVHAAFAAEPSSFGRSVVRIPTFVAVAVTYARFPEASAFRIGVVGIASGLLFSVLGGLVGALNSPTSGSPLVAARLALLWVGSVAVAAAAVYYPREG